MNLNANDKTYPLDHNGGLFLSQTHVHGSVPHNTRDRSSRLGYHRSIDQEEDLEEADLRPCADEFVLAQHRTPQMIFLDSLPLDGWVVDHDS